MRMDWELTDDMTVLEMLIAWEEYQIWRFHGKNTRQEDYPSEQQVRDQAIENIDSYSNVALLEQMQFVMDERKEQRVKREKARLQLQEG